MIERVFYGIGGACLGALVGLGIAIGWLDSFSWVPIVVCSGVSALLALLWGAPVLNWLKEIWWWVD